MKTAVIAISAGGRRLADRIAAGIGAERAEAPDGIMAAMARLWRGYDGFVLVMACGIAVRAVAPLLEDKRRDPAVVVMDEAGRFAVSLVSGHLGGANELARRAAAASGGVAVITTASDVTGRTSLDLWLRGHGLAAPPALVTRASALLVNRGHIMVCDRVGYPLPEDFRPTGDPAAADLVISMEWRGEHARPLPLFLGVGCNRATPAAEIEAACADFLAETGLARAAVAGVASIDLKKDEPGLTAFARQNRWPLFFYTSGELNRIPVARPSAAVIRATGAAGVAEPAAVLAAGNGELIAEKRKWQNVTMAAAVSAWSAPVRATKGS